jgi:hypothetical protein
MGYRMVRMAGGKEMTERTGVSVSPKDRASEKGGQQKGHFEP